MTGDFLTVSEVIPPEGGVYLRLDLRAGLQGVLLHVSDDAAANLWIALGQKLGLFKPLEIGVSDAPAP